MKNPAVEKTIRILTLVIYVFIPIRTEHFGGFWGMFVVFSLFDNSVLGVLLSVLTIGALSFLTFSIFKPKANRDRIFVPVSLAALALRLVPHFSYLREVSDWVNPYPFAVVFGIFLLFGVVWTVTVYTGKK